MAIGKRLLILTTNDSQTIPIHAAATEWGCLVSSCATAEELRGMVEGSDHDMVFIDDTAALRRLIGEADPEGDLLRTSLAEMEKRHILRVLVAASGNKTRAAKTLGIDTKTLYNKLKSYGVSVEVAKRRAQQNAALGETT